MRIVGGIHKGRGLVAPTGIETRPTTDRVRESVFNILAHRDDVKLEEARVLDLFAGSGALGFESLSRGASFCLFVETAPDARASIRDNQEALSLIGSTRIHRRSATDLGPRPDGMGAHFSLAFLDPPYRQALAGLALESMRDGEWLAPGACCVVEQDKREDMFVVEGYTLDDERVFGKTVVRFFTFGRGR